MVLSAKQIAGFSAELAGIEEAISKPDAPKDQQNFVSLTRRYKELQEITEKWGQYLEAQADIEAAEELLDGSSVDERALVQSEIEQAVHRLADLTATLTDLILPKDPDDDKNVIVEIRGAEGGEEGNLFARDLFDMYSAYASKKGWKTEQLSCQMSSNEGFEKIIFSLSGSGVWKHLKFEGGPHRVQRVPKTESQGRIHTSTATVSILPEADEVEIEIKDSDLEIDVYRSSGPGGQSVNTTDSAVRITHKPTGIEVSMQDEKSQLQNKKKAMQVLRARLLQQEKEKQSKERSEQKRGQIKSGGRSEKVRTYNFKENRVTDHRLSLTLHKLDRVLAGDIDEFINALIQQDQDLQKNS